MQENIGYISGNDGKRYQFYGSEWREQEPPCRGEEVDFDIDATGRAIVVFRKMDGIVQDKMAVKEALSPERIRQYDIERDYTPFDWIKHSWQNYVTFEGRARRAECWSMILFHNIMIFMIFIIMLMPFMISDHPSDSDASILFILSLCMIFVIFIAAFFLPILAVSVRRLHDINLSGLWLLIHFVPFGNLVILILLLIDTKPKTNQWGPPAKLVR